MLSRVKKNYLVKSKHLKRERLLSKTEFFLKPPDNTIITAKYKPETNSQVYTILPLILLKRRM